MLLQIRDGCEAAGSEEFRCVPSGGRAFVAEDQIGCCWYVHTFDVYYRLTFLSPIMNVHQTSHTALSRKTAYYTLYDLMFCFGFCSFHNWSCHHGDFVHS